MRPPSFSCFYGTVYQLLPWEVIPGHCRHYREVMSRRHRFAAIQHEIVLAVNKWQPRQPILRPKEKGAGVGTRPFFI
jgi:hypothetical protein